MKVVAGKSVVGKKSGSKCRGKKTRRALFRLCTTTFIPLHHLTLSKTAEASIPLSIPNSGNRGERSAYKQSAAASTPKGGEKAEDALELLLEARRLEASGDYSGAFQKFDTIVRAYGDLAIVEYARLGRAITRYEVDDKNRAIIELEYEVFNNVGLSEAHAGMKVEKVKKALSVACWAKGKIDLAETQWEIATEFEPRFADPKWVTENKHWGPELTKALESFLNLK